MSQRRRPSKKQSSRKINSTLAKEISVMAWIPDAYGNVLFVQQIAGRQLWSLPGGKVRAGEALKQALRREVKEEIGLTVLSAKVIDIFDRPLKAGLCVLFQTVLRKGRLKLGETEIKDATFVAKLPTQSTPSVRYFWNRQFSRFDVRGNTLDL